MGSASDEQKTSDQMATDYLIPGTKDGQGSPTPIGPPRRQSGGSETKVLHTVLSCLSRMYSTQYKLASDGTFSLLLCEFSGQKDHDQSTLWRTDDRHLQSHHLGRSVAIACLSMASRYETALEFIAHRAQCLQDTCTSALWLCCTRALSSKRW